MKITTTKQVRQHGNSLTVNVTKECGILGVGRGDTVEVTIEKKEDRKPKWGIYDSDGRLDCDPEPMVFDTRSQAVEFLNSDAYDGKDGYYVDEY